MEDSCTASSAQNRKPKAHWTDEETRILLKVWEDHIGDLRRAKRNLQVYVAMAECPRAQGVEKSIKEIKSKIENLRNRYRRKTTGQGAITWPYYKEIARFLGCLPVNDSSLMDETGDDENVSVEMLIDSMQQEPPSPADDESSTQAAVSELPSPPPYESCQPSALPSPSSPLPAAPSTDQITNSTTKQRSHRTPPPNTSTKQPPSNTTTKQPPNSEAKQACHTKEPLTRSCQHKS
ncbi:hypothetical protein V5799_025667 [Amblyomma americanum]|uniref:Myb/SANT-like DNA-binding domain-containing protein n=1 Tax=Amblyomma americanum TaxID=6943 RepID=A0AAQ4E8V5_AMBAM